MLDELIDLSTTFIDPHHQPNPSQFGTSASHAHTMPPRRRAHSKSQSISSAPDNTLLNSSPFPKPPTPARRTPRVSTTSPPMSPTFATAPLVRKRKSQIPTPLQFPLVVVLSFTLSTLLFALIAEFTSGELAAISKHTESWVEIAGLLGWKVVELGVYWFGGFDALDVASLSLLLSTPHTLLLSYFFAIQPSTLILTTVANLVSATTPFFLLRSLSPPHAPSSAPKALVRNRPILTDPYTALATSLLATAIFAVLLQYSFFSFLPTFMITRFNHLRTLEKAHLGAAGLPTLIIALLPTGLACMEFLFLPSTGVVNAHLYAGSFQPASATFGQHVYHNAWGWYSARQRELIKRTIVASVLVVAEGVVQTWGTIKGVELLGAVGYAGVFGFGVALVGMVYEWVGGPSG